MANGKNLFNSVRISKPGKNFFDMSHDVKMSLNMGDLVPVCCVHAVPGDKFKIGCESLIRFAPMIAPVMHRLDVTVHYFFVPNRILWPNFEDFITHTKQAGAIPAAPFVKYTSVVGYSKLADYLGLPDPIGGFNEDVSAFPFAAYQKVYNDYYRDQNLQTDIESACELVDGLNGTIDSSVELFKLRRRAWEHDYFTSCLPFAQKGDAVEIPMSGLVELDASADPNPGLIRFASGQGIVGGVHELGEDDTIQTGSMVVNPNDPTPSNRDQVVYDPNGTLIMNSAGSDINELRKAYALQRFLEKLARGGSRYFETIKSMFGITSPDARLQRPEYITGVKSPVMISEVLNTTGTDDLPQGNMAGHAASVVSGKYGSYFCQEHGMIMGIMSVMPKTAYQQGINRHWLKFDPLDYYFPDFANIGEQEVKNREVYAFQANPDDTFGYNPRYSEYKFENNRVAGDFKTSLNYWHFGRIFSTPPALNEDFIKSDPTTRPFAVTGSTTDKLYCHVLNKITAVRPMPKYGTPTF